MEDIRFFIILLVVVVVLAALAQRLSLPYPIVLLIGGAAAGWIPGVPQIQIDPELALVIFLAPVLFHSGFTTSWRDFRTNIIPISMLAIGAVLVTMLAVGATSRLIFVGMPWAVALTLGAIVSPPDAVAATSVLARVGVPRRMSTIIEGESLVNDSSALIAYQYAVAAVVSGHFSLREASTGFLLIGTISVAAGLAVGWLLMQLLPLIDDAVLSIGLTVIVPLPIYIVADHVGLSGVLAVVAAAILIGRYSTQTFSSRSRLGIRSVWSVSLIVLNSLVFLLIGFQFVERLQETSLRESMVLAGKALIISLVVIVSRFVWVAISGVLTRLIPGEERDVLPWRMSIAIAWTGLRGIVSVSSALALPFLLDDGSRFAWRGDVIVVAFIVIVVTLIGQGLTLPWLLRTLHIEPSGEEMREKRLARRAAARAALERLDEVQDEPWVDPRHQQMLRFRYSHLLDIESENKDQPEYQSEHMESEQRLRDTVLEAARRAVVAARDRGEIGDETRLDIERELDLEDERTIL